MKYLLERLKEPSTWRGIIMVATGVGASWSPQSQEAIVYVGVSLAGVVGALLPDSWKK
jgi:hypothetical protein